MEGFSLGVNNNNNNSYFSICAALHSEIQCYHSHQEKWAGYPKKIVSVTWRLGKMTTLNMSFKNI